jgi:putative glutamine amidotransferase
MNKKVIGVIPNLGDDSIFIPNPYMKFASEVMGSKAVVIHDLEQIKTVDTILLMGGRDIDPTLFGQENLGSKKVHRKMDEFHLSAIDAALGYNKGIFGICRGFQLLYYKFLMPHFGNTEVPGASMWYVQDVDGHNQSSLDLPRENPYHSVTKRSGERIFVNSFHHQCVAALEGVQNRNFISHYTRFNAGKEAVIVEGINFLYLNSVVTGVQWHPEDMETTPEFYNSLSQGAEYWE